VHQAYITDIEASVKEALARVDPLPFYMAYGENFWAGVKAHLDTVTDRAAAPIIAKYTGVLAAADIEVLPEPPLRHHAVIPLRLRTQRTSSPVTML
jgi:hypothetical protein